MIAYLDMTAMSSTTRFLAIGSEATPFLWGFQWQQKDRERP
jgi:hypothetical protein